MTLKYKARIYSIRDILLYDQNIQSLFYAAIINNISPQKAFDFDRAP